MVENAEVDEDLRLFARAQIASCCLHLPIDLQGLLIASEALVEDGLVCQDNALSSLRPGLRGMRAGDAQGTVVVRCGIRVPPHEILDVPQIRDRLGARRLVMRRIGEENRRDELALRGSIVACIQHRQPYAIRVAAAAPDIAVSGVDGFKPPHAHHGWRRDSHPRRSPVLQSPRGSIRGSHAGRCAHQQRAECGEGSIRMARCLDSHGVRKILLEGSRSAQSRGQAEGQKGGTQIPVPGDLHHVSHYLEPQNDAI